jgi:Protein of unknown function (DUF3396)
MSSKSITSRENADLELIDDGIKLVSLTFGINMYTNQSFYMIPQEVLKTFELFLQRCPAQQLNFYATETMKEHKPVTKRSLGMLTTWLSPEAPHKNYIALEFKTAVGYQDAPMFKYEVWSADASLQSNIISMALPSDLAKETPSEMFAFVAQLADAFPFRCGLAGYAFECSRYDKRKSETHAWNTSMRHTGVDIVRIPLDAKAVGSDGVKGVNWLTLIDAGLLAEVGGVRVIREQLSSEIEIVECKYGTILKAGSSPSLGDVNRGDVLPLYKEVYRLLEPQIALAAKQSMSFQLVRDYVERTQAWYKRHGT